MTELDIASLPAPRGAACVNWSPSLAHAPRDKHGLCPLTLERFVRFLCKRARVVAQLSDAHPDYVQACTAGGTPYRHLDESLRAVGASLRDALRPMFAGRDPDAAAEHVLSLALRATVLHLAMGRPATFVEWRAWQGAGGVGLPTSDADLVSFRAFLLETGAKRDGEREPLFGNAYQTRGYTRTANLVTQLLAKSRALAAKMRAERTWEATVGHMISDLEEVAGFFGGQALCYIYHGVVGGDAPGGPFRTRLLPNLDPVSLMKFATPGGGPKESLAAIFGPRMRGSHAEKIAWLAANADKLLAWAGLAADFPWEPAPDALLDGAVRGGAPAGKRPISAVDVENMLCFI